MDRIRNTALNTPLHSLIEILMRSTYILWLLSYFVVEILNLKNQENLFFPGISLSTYLEFEFWRSFFLRHQNIDFLWRNQIYYDLQPFHILHKNINTYITNLNIIIPSITLQTSWRYNCNLVYSLNNPLYSFVAILLVVNVHSISDTSVEIVNGVNKYYLLSLVFLCQQCPYLPLFKKIHFLLNLFFRLCLCLCSLPLSFVSPLAYISSMYFCTYFFPFLYLSL